jgi:cellobiose PTS system EIIC component
MDNNNKFFKFLEKYVMGPMGKIAQFRIVRAVMAAGMASIPFTIVGSMFLVLNILPTTFTFLKGFFNESFFRISDLYMLANTSTMGILALYFGLVFGYEYTQIQAQEEKISVNPLNGALLSMFAFFLCIPELVVKDGSMKLLNVVTKSEKVINGFRMDATIQRLGTSGIFTAIIMAILAVKIYSMCVKRQWVIKLPASVPAGVSRSFTALIPAFLITFAVLIINGALIALGTDIFKVVAVPFGFVTNLTNTWLGILVIYFLIHALWIVGIHGATIITSLLTPIVLANMVANQNGANIPFAGEFNNMYVTVGGSGATLGLVIFILLFAKSAQLKALGKVAIVPAFFNINEPILFGLPLVYNAYLAIPFFLAPMTAASIGYFAIKLHLVNPVIVQVPWPSPVGIGGFIGTGGDWRGAVLAIVTATAAFLIYYPFIKFYDNKLYKEEQSKAAELEKSAAKN